VQEVLSRYVATVDWPACSMWEELAAANPEAKILLSTRPSERWWDSYSSTIHLLMSRPEPTPEEIAALPPEMAAVGEMADLLITRRSFGTDDYRSLTDADIVDAYERHNEAVRRMAPADRFLEFDVVQGWEPLCALLGVPVPDEPFPNVNDREQFWATFGSITQP